MSFLDSLLGRSFSGMKCKTLMTLTVSRIKLVKNKKELQMKQMEKEVAQCLENGQEATAQIRVEHIIREQNILAAYDIIELFCELLCARIHIIDSQRECPMDLREAVASLIFVAPRCSDLPELLHIQNLFSAKYGKEFASAALELRPNCCVNRQIIEKLSVRTPAADIRLTTLKNIAENYNISWDSARTESQLYKFHEDLLDGANHLLIKAEVSPKRQNEFPVTASRAENRTYNIKSVSSSCDNDPEYRPEEESKILVNNSSSSSDGNVLDVAQKAMAEAEIAIAAARAAAEIAKITIAPAE